MQITNDSGKVGGLVTRLRSLMPAILKNHLSNNKAPTSESVNNSQEREPDRVDCQSLTESASKHNMSRKAGTTEESIS